MSDSDSDEDSNLDLKEKLARRREKFEKYMMAHKPGGHPNKEKSHNVRRKAGSVKKHPAESAKKPPTADHHHPVRRGILKKPPRPPTPCSEEKTKRKGKHNVGGKKGAVVQHKPKKPPSHHEKAKSSKNVRFTPNTRCHAAIVTHTRLTSDVELMETLEANVTTKREDSAAIECKSTDMKKCLGFLNQYLEVLDKIEDNRISVVSNEDQMLSKANYIQKRLLTQKNNMNVKNIFPKETEILKLPSIQDAKMTKILVEQHKNIITTYNRPLTNPLSGGSLRVSYIRRERARIKIQRENAILAKKLLKVQSKIPKQQ